MDGGQTLAKDLINSKKLLPINCLIDLLGKENWPRRAPMCPRLRLRDVSDAAHPVPAHPLQETLVIVSLMVPCDSGVGRVQLD